MFFLYVRLEYLAYIIFILYEEVLIFSARQLSVQFSGSVMSNSLRPHGLQYARLPVHHQLLELTQTHVH